MALKMKENYQKNATAAAKRQAASSVNVYRNRTGRAITFPNAPIATYNTQKNQDKLPNDCKDVESLKGRFSWKLIAGYYVPYIIRVINGEQLKFVSVRMVETQLLSNYLHYLHTNILTCTSVRGSFITKSESKLLNDINQIHANCIYGKGLFLAGKDYIVSLEDAHEFYTFIEVCYEKIMRNITPGRIEKCGFIRINSGLVLPYCNKDNQKYVPLFYFKGESEKLNFRFVKLKNWNLAYMKFCCKVLGIISYELSAGDSCTAIRLDDIKNYFSPENNFEEYWPAKLVDKHRLIQKSTNLHPPGAWIQAPPEVVPAKNTIPRTLTGPAPLPPNMPVMMNTYKNGWPSKRMSSTMSQGSSFVNNAGHFVPPSPLGRTGNTTPVIEPALQLYNQCSNNSQAQQQQWKQQQTQLQHQIITTPRTQQSYSGQSVHDRLTNRQQRYPFRNAGPSVIALPLKTIDLSLPPPSPISPALQENPLRPDFRFKLMKIPERMRVFGSSNNVAYKIQKTTLQGKIIHCINARPYFYSNLMVILDELVQIVLTSITVAECAYVLNKCYKTTLFSGNSEQLAVLRENGLLNSMYRGETPMARLQDVARALLELKPWVFENHEPSQRSQAAAPAAVASAAASEGGPAKRQRTC